MRWLARPASAGQPLAWDRHEEVAERFEAGPRANARWAPVPDYLDTGRKLKGLEKAFTDLRGRTPVAHMRNVRLDRARRALDETDATVAEVAARFGFRSSTTFALEYRKRFGMAPSRTKRAIAD